MAKQWQSPKQERAALLEENGKLKKENKQNNNIKADLLKMIAKRRKQNTHMTRQGAWTIPDKNLSLSISEINDIIGHG